MGFLFSIVPIRIRMPARYVIQIRYFLLFTFFIRLRVESKITTFGTSSQLRGQIPRLGGQSIAYVRKKQYLCTGFEKARYDFGSRFSVLGLLSNFYRTFIEFSHE